MNDDHDRFYSSARDANPPLPSLKPSCQPNDIAWPQSESFRGKSARQDEGQDFRSPNSVIYDQ